MWKINKAWSSTDLSPVVKQCSWQNQTRFSLAFFFLLTNSNYKATGHTQRGIYTPTLLFKLGVTMGLICIVVDLLA